MRNEFHTIVISHNRKEKSYRVKLCLYSAIYTGRFTV